MEKRFVTVYTNSVQCKMQLIQFIVQSNGSIRAICMDEVGNFQDFEIDKIKGEGFEI
jgi:hypothetical protein